MSGMGPPLVPLTKTKSTSPLHKSPQLRPSGSNTLISDFQGGPVEPHVLADAISKLDNLRLVRTPSTTNNGSPASGASSPKPVSLPGADNMAATMAGMEGVKTAGQGSVPGTPHFGAQSEL